MDNLEGLSDRDRAVLRSIFDPTATIADVVDIGDTFPQDDQGPITDAEKLSASMISDAVKLAEGGKLQEALELMNKAVEADPDRPEVYNDRAQLLRLMQRDDEAMADLSRTLSLTAVTLKPRARAMALCQRGVLLRKAGKDDEARAAFAEAATLGSGFAKKQVVELNPYAALCNKMLSQVMRGEKDIKL